jgi:hypothetical protein
LRSLRRVCYTKSMTKTENTRCHFCQGPATNLKKEAELVGQETLNGALLPDAEKITYLPIDEACNEKWYDGTETYPALLPL